MCNLNICIAKTAHKRRLREIERFIVTNHTSYLNNSHGMGVVVGNKVKKSQDSFPLAYNIKAWEHQRVLIGHTRLATCGNAETSLQPFQTDDWVFVHNGIASFKDTKDMTVYSDSWHMFDMIMKAEGASMPEKIASAIEQGIYGSYSCFISNIVTGESVYFKNSSRAITCYENGNSVFLTTSDRYDIWFDDCTKKVVSPNVAYWFWYDNNGSLNRLEYDLPTATKATPEFNWSNYEERKESKKKKDVLGKWNKWEDDTSYGYLNYVPGVDDDVPWHMEKELPYLDLDAEVEEEWIEFLKTLDLKTYSEIASDIYAHGPYSALDKESIMQWWNWYGVYPGYTYMKENVLI